MEKSFKEVLTVLDAHVMNERMPVLFVGHGSPLNAINNSACGATWNEIGTHLPIPRAIVCMSAHWLTSGTYVSSIQKPKLIYDFYGFSPELYAVEYSVEGSKELAEEICRLAPSIKKDTERGLDHGVWTVLMHLFPKANIPVLQISIDVEHSRKAQYELMQTLKPLRDTGVLFIGSGNIVHNLQYVREGGAYDWADEFDLLSKKLITEKNISVLTDIEAESPLAPLAIPSDDHYRPMLNTLALMDEDESISFFNEEIDLGSISMRSFIVMS